MDDNILNKSKKAAKFSAIFQILSQVSGFIATVFLVRALSEHDYGIYNLLYSVISLIGMIASFGIANMLTRYIPEYYEKGEFIIAHNLYKISVFIRLMTSVVALGLILLLWDHIAPILKLTDYKIYFMLFTLIVVLHMQRGILEICLASYFLHKYSKFIGFIFSIIKAVGYGYLIIYNKNLWTALIIDIIANVVVFTALQLIYFYKIPFTEGKLSCFPKKEKKKITKYALFYNFNDAGVGMLSANFDHLIIVALLDPIAVGAYAFSVKLANDINKISPFFFLKDVINPLFFASGTSSDSFNATSFFQFIVKLNFIISTPILFFLILYSKNIINIVFDGKFIEFSSVLCGVFFFSLVRAVPINLVAQLKERADIILYSKIFAVYNLIADIVLIKFFGIWGAVVATGTAAVGKTFFIWFFVRYEASFKGMGYFFMKLSFGWMVLTGVLSGVNNILYISEHILLVMGVVVFGLAFLFQFKLGLFNTYEKNAIEKLLKNKRMFFLKNLLLNKK